MYRPTIDINLIIDSIKLVEQEHKKELDKKDETITRFEASHIQMEREYSDYKRITEKENRKLLIDNQTLRQELSKERAERLDDAERFKEEIARLSYDLRVQVSRVVQLKDDQEKANHIISVLISKLKGQTNPQSLPIRHSKSDLSK